MAAGCGDDAAWLKGDLPKIEGRIFICGWWCWVLGWFGEGRLRG